MSNAMSKVSTLTTGMHPAVKVGALIAAAALAWYAVKIYQRNQEGAAE